MKVKIILFCICVVLCIILGSFIGLYENSKEVQAQEVVNRQLSRAEQIQLMKQCYIDTKIVIDDGRVKSTEMAITFFYYRTGMLPIAQ